MFLEIQSRIADFQKNMVFLWQGHDFRGFGGLENHHFRRSKASKKASAEKWALGRKKNRSKTGFGARPGGGKRSETLRDRLWIDFGSSNGAPGAPKSSRKARKCRRFLACCLSVESGHQNDRFWEPKSAKNKPENDARFCWKRKIGFCKMCGFPIGKAHFSMFDE